MGTENINHQLLTSKDRLWERLRLSRKHMTFITRRVNIVVGWNFKIFPLKQVFKKYRKTVMSSLFQVLIRFPF